MRIIKLKAPRSWSFAVVLFVHVALVTYWIFRPTIAGAIGEGDATLVCQRQFDFAEHGRITGVVPYEAPGLRMRRLTCTSAKNELGEFRQAPDQVIGVPATRFQPLVTYRNLFVRVRGTPRQRADAAADLLLNGAPGPALRSFGAKQDDAACPAEDKDGALHFCIKSRDERLSGGTTATRCTATPSGSVQCARSARADLLAICRRQLDAKEVTAVELVRTAGEAERTNTGLEPRAVMCQEVEDSVERVGREAIVHFGEDASGRVVIFPEPDGRP